MKVTVQTPFFRPLIASVGIAILGLSCTHQKPEGGNAQVRKIASAQAELQNDELQAVDSEEAAGLDPGEPEEIRNSRSPHSKIRKDFEALFGQYPEEKIQACSVAIDEILKLNFFSDGRGMMISPGLINLYRATPRFAKKTLLTRTLGLNYIDGRAQGLFWEKYQKNTIGVLGCVACHSGQAAGYYIVGLGNKNIDVQSIGSLAYRRGLERYSFCQGKAQQSLQRTDRRFAGFCQDPEQSELYESHPGAGPHRNYSHMVLSPGRKTHSRKSPSRCRESASSLGLRRKTKNGPVCGWRRQRSTSGLGYCR